MEAHKNEAIKILESKNANVDSSALDAREENKKEATKNGSVHRVRDKIKNSVRKLRMEKMVSKAELARRAGVSTLTIDRVERGMSCRMDTKRKILEALGLKPQDRVLVFGDSEED